MRNIASGYGAQLGGAQGDSTVNGQTQSEIQSGMSDVEREIETATDRLSSLHIALGAVMTPGVPTDSGDRLKSVNDGPHTPLGQALEVHTTRLRQVNASLLDILNRIQL